MNKTLFATAASFCLLLGACKQIDKTKAQDAITDYLKKEEFAVKGVSCPEGVKAKTGDEFTCTATLESGETLDVKVTQKDNQGNVEWKLASLKIAPKKLATKIGEGKQVTDVSCGDKVITPKKDDTVTCTAKLEGEEKDVEVTFTDDEGSVKWKTK